jgi:hypothetical protein
MGSLTSIVRGGSADAGRKGDDRVALREAIKAAAQAEADAENHRAALYRARSLITRAEKRLERAGVGVAEAKAESGRLTAAAIVTGEDDNVAGGAGLMRAARAAELSALDEVDTARGALATLQSGLPAALDAPLAELREQINAHSGRAVDVSAAARALNHVVQELAVDPDIPLPGA